MTQLKKNVFVSVNTLVLGAGGGADIMSAIAIIESEWLGLKASQCFAGVAKSRRTNIAGTLSGFFKSNPERSRPAATRLGTHLIQMNKIPCSLPQLENGAINWKKVNQRWKAPLMEECLPRVGAEPFFMLHALTGQESIEQATLELRQFCTERNIEQIIAVDNGGDILKPIENMAEIESAGRDQKVLEVLKAIALPTFVVVVAPGSDGDFTQVEMAQLRNQFVETHQDLGVFSLNPFRPTFTRLSKWMGSQRTFNIVNQSWKKAPNGEGIMTVHRGKGKYKRQQNIPHKWIQSGWVFQLKIE